jgi:hypothetical protein
MWSTVKCPRCSTLVDPKVLTVGGGPPPSEAEEGKRWSFLWTVPRGDFCPNCDFPLSKYFGRIKWIRTMAVGVAIVLVALALQLIGAIGRFAALNELMKYVIRIGAVVTMVGAVGIIVGGRHGRVRASDGA